MVIQLIKNRWLGGALLCVGLASALPAQAQSDLSVSKTAAPTVVAGGNLTYTVKVTNSGPDAATNVNLSDALPGGTTFVSASQTSGPAFNLTTPPVGAGGTVTATAASFGAAETMKYPQNLFAAGSTLFFTASNAATGRELWKSDGTVAGTVLVKDITPGTGSSSIALFTNVNGTIFFVVNDGINGQELWKTDGTPEGTTLVKDIVAGSEGSFPQGLFNFNGTLYFSAIDATHGRELWKSDGTEAGTTLVKDIATGSGNSNPMYLTNVNGTLFFTASDSSRGNELWKSDGTQLGTALVKDIWVGVNYSNPVYLTNVNGTLFFSANDGVNGQEIWKSDGTQLGTTLVKDIRAGSDSSIPSYCTNVNGTLFFSAGDSINGTELWKSDGTEAGTTLVKDINPGTASSGPFAFNNVNGTLFFTAFNPTTGVELWKSDGTETGTVLVKDIWVGTSGSSPNFLVNVNGTLFFSTNDGIHGYKLWKSDGTEAGTVMVKDPTNDVTQNFNFPTNVNGTLFFSANDGINSTELWKSDGTNAGTVPIRFSISSSFEIVVNVGESTSGTISNTANVISDADSDGSNNSGTATTAVRHTPSALSLSRDEVQEKLPSGAFVGGFSTTDADAGNTFTYSLVPGDGDTDNSQFAIGGVNLRTAASFDVAAKSSYNIRVRTTDNTGLWFEQPFTITVVETTKPVATISSPTTNQKVLLSALTGDVLSGTATDNVGVVAVKARLSRKGSTGNEYWNGTAFGAAQAWLSATVHTVTVDTVGGPNVTWTLDGQLPPADKLVVGAYGLQVYALDGANNKSAYANATFNVVSDAVAPTLSINTPTSNQKVLISDFNGSAVSGTVNDDLGVASVKVRLSRKRGTANEYWNGTNFVSASAYVDATVAGTSWSLGTATPAAEKLDNGAYLVEAYALDNGGNKSATSKVGFTLNSDYSAPSVAIVTPTSSQVIKINEFGAGIITGSAADNIGVTSVKLKLQRKRGTSYEYWNGTAFTTTSVLVDATYNSESGTWSYDSAIPASSLDAGGYTLYATAFDAAGNAKTSSSRGFSVVGTAGAGDAAASDVSSAAEKSAGRS